MARVRSGGLGEKATVKVGEGEQRHLVDCPPVGALEGFSGGAECGTDCLLENSSGSSLDLRQESCRGVAHGLSASSV